MIRIFDIVFSFITLVLLAPLFLPIIILLRISGEGEVFYLQERVGKEENRFYVIKFATMLKNSVDLPGGTITIKNDPRILPFGRLLRDTKVNELPQLINVLKGDMSLIGPRPMAVKNYEYYDDLSRSKISLN